MSQEQNPVISSLKKSVLVFATKVNLPQDVKSSKHFEEDENEFDVAVSRRSVKDRY